MVWFIVTWETVCLGKGRFINVRVEAREKLNQALYFWRGLF